MTTIWNHIVNYAPVIASQTIADCLNIPQCIVFYDRKMTEKIVLAAISIIILSGAHFSHANMYPTGGNFIKNNVSYPFPNTKARFNSQSLIVRVSVKSSTPFAFYDNQTKTFRGIEIQLVETISKHLSLKPVYNLGDDSGNGFCLSRYL